MFFHTSRSSTSGIRGGGAPPLRSVDAARRLEILRRLRIFGQRDKLKTDRSKRGVRSGCKEKAAQRGIQSAGGDGGAFRGENPDGAVGRVWGSPDDDQQLEAGAGEACGGAVWARQQGAGGRGCAEGDRRSAPEDRTAA